ncbi:MAG: hypothetical protein JOZ24_04335, partial [Candidatus Eremiobacteraeota bacterium]|nr:hypothetical protein [Candidatus Eremiobacteraeota bacterium]
MLRAASLLTAAGLFVAFGPAAIRGLSRDRLGLLIFALAVSCVLGLLRRPGVHPAGTARVTPESDRIRLLVPVVLAVLAIGGWIWAVAAATTAYVVRPARPRRRAAVADRILGAAVIVPAWAAAVLIAPALRALVAERPSVAAAALFATIAAGFVFVQELLWLDGLVALRSARSPLTVWRERARDLRAIPVLAEAAWGY